MQMLPAFNDKISKSIHSNLVLGRWKCIIDISDSNTVSVHFYSSLWISFLYNSWCILHRIPAAFWMPIHPFIFRFWHFHSFIVYSSLYSLMFHFSVPPIFSFFLFWLSTYAIVLRINIWQNGTTNAKTKRKSVAFANFQYLCISIFCLFFSFFFVGFGFGWFMCMSVVPYANGLCHLVMVNKERFTVHQDNKTE